MAESDLTYALSDEAALPLAVSIFIERPHVREQVRADVAAAELTVRDCEPLSALVDGPPRPLGEVILVDCPRVDAGALAALSRLDARAAHAGAHLIVSTSVAALEDVFACCDQSAPQILVDPSRAERVLALGRITARAPALRLRELSGADRMTLLRLTEQVGEIAQRLDRFGDQQPAIRGDDKALRLESPTLAWSVAENSTPERQRTLRPPLPHPRLVRRIIRQRQLRARYFDGELFVDPAWNMLLDLTAARAEHMRVSVTSLCIASGVPPTTALRWIGQLAEAGLVERIQDETDRRRVFIGLTDRAADAIARYFAEIEVGAAELV